MNIHWLKTFLKAAETENFRQASEELYITQPAVTKHIKRLEEELDIQLFERTGKAVKLTEAGLSFLPHAKEMARSFESNMSAFNAWKQGYTRKLSIACAPQIASSFLPKLLKRFIEKFPNIDVHVDIARSYDIGEKVSSGLVDIGLARMPSVYANTSSVIIDQEPIVLAGPIVEEADEISLLAGYRLLTHNHPGYWEALIKDLKKENPHLKTMTVSQIEVTKRFIEAGLGISYLPKSMVQDELLAGRLGIYPSGSAEKQTSITYLIEKVLTAEAEQFKQFLRHQLKKSEQL
ncbi:LysR family transcriptional regulator [Domibacillus indicus]|uniref:LysR family transcriptional regulator n=1 Tax=Domibacillus indicus TaxID=1437523 RepID=UPI0006181C67|nr:LysR family transcriptional regulator [Domibacillus indicus]